MEETVNTMLVALGIGIFAVLVRLIIRRQSAKASTGVRMPAKQFGRRLWIFLPIAIVAYIAIFNLTAIDGLVDRVQGRVTLADIEHAGTDNLCGRLAADDAPTLTPAYAPPFFTIRADSVTATDFYMIKDPARLDDINKTERQTADDGRQAIRRKQTAFEVMRDPNKYASLYNRLYAVPLSDSTHILVWAYNHAMQPGPDGRITTPIGTLRPATAAVARAAASTGLPGISTDMFVVAFDDEHYVSYENIRLIVRGVLAFAAVGLIYLLVMNIGRKRP